MRRSPFLHEKETRLLRVLQEYPEHSLERLADLICYSRTTTCMLIRSLERQGRISTTQGRGRRPNRYLVLPLN